jgi:hypothetical protein|tara:strand:- start:1361 stop:1483 length:123 start_codon:yes stop_codon:yes gene_type:complete
MGKGWNYQNKCNCGEIWTSKIKEGMCKDCSVKLKRMKRAE